METNQNQANPLQSFMNNNPQQSTQTFQGSPSQNQSSTSPNNNKTKIILGAIAVILLCSCFLVVTVAAIFVLNRDNDKNDGNKVETTTTPTVAPSVTVKPTAIDEEDYDLSGLSQECREYLESLPPDDEDITQDMIDKVSELCADELSEDFFIEGSEKEQMTRWTEVLEKNTAKKSDAKINLNGVTFEIKETINYGKALEQSVPCEDANDRDCIPKDCSAKTGYYFLLKIEVVNTGSDNVFISEPTVFGEEKTPYYPTIRAFCKYEYLEDGNAFMLDSQQKTTIHMLYDVPSPDKKLILEFFNSDFENPKYDFVDISDIVK